MTSLNLASAPFISSIISVFFPLVSVICLFFFVDKFLCLLCFFYFYSYFVTFTTFSTITLILLLSYCFHIFVTSKYYLSFHFMEHTLHMQGKRKKSFLNGALKEDNTGS